MKNTNPKDVSSALEIIKEQEKTIERQKALLKAWMISEMALKNLAAKYGMRFPRADSAIKEFEPMRDNKSIESSEGGINRSVIIHQIEAIKNRESNRQVGDAISGNDVNDDYPAALEKIKKQEKTIERQKALLKEWMIHSHLRSLSNAGSNYRAVMGNAKTTRAISILREEARKTDCPDRLSFLADHIDAEVRSGVARNINTPVEQLTKLSKDYEDEVRIGIVNNINTPQDVLEYMSCDLNHRVRLAIATNSNTPLNILILLSRDISSDVRYRVALNSNSSDQIINELVADSDFEIRIGIASLKKIPKEAVVKLSKDVSPAIRRKIAEKNNTPKYILLELAKDDVFYVKRAAEAHPKLRKKV
jgi:hypothetical protein